MLNLSTIYTFIHVSGCVGRDPSTLLCPVAYNAVNAALTKIVVKMTKGQNTTL